MITGCEKACFGQGYCAKHYYEHIRKPILDARKLTNQRFSGHKHSKKTKKKLSILRSKRMGENSPNWKGGISTASTLLIEEKDQPLNILQLPAKLKFDPEKNIDEPAIHRKFECPDYNKCLDYAAQKNWRSFSCIKCEGK